MDGDDFREETLDPGDWAGLRGLAQSMIDDMLKYLETVRERPVWEPVPEVVRQSFETPVPHEPQGYAQAYTDFKENVLPYPTGNIHPRFWAWVMGTGTPFAALAEMLAATVNPNLWGGQHAANHVESQVIDWFRSLLGFPKQTSGLLVSGASMANLTGLIVARNAQATFDVREHGLQAAKKRLTLYASAEVHSSILKAVEVIGLGRAALRLIDVRDDFSVDIAKLELSIRTDLEMGLQPFCVIGSAGTVNTGAIDDLHALADLCARYNLWFHVDGAFGALAALAPQAKTRVSGIERADSLAFDLHKWFYMPFEAGCLLIQRPDEHRAAFSLRPVYLATGEQGLGQGGATFADHGIELSRGFRALKIWMSIKADGIDKFARLIQQNIDQAQYLADQISAAPNLELMAPVSLNVVCFRYNPGDLSEFSLSRLNESLLYELQQQGIAAPSATQINGRFVLRCAIVNHRSRKEDFDLLIDQVRLAGRRLSREITRERQAIRITSLR